MTRKEAIAWFEEDMERIGEIPEDASEEVLNYIAEAKEIKRIALEALQPWVRTAGRAPTEADADNDGNVLAYYTWSEGKTLVTVEGVCKQPSTFPYWMPIPPMPEVEE